MERKAELTETCCSEDDAEGEIREKLIVYRGLG
jgi:hypothetical protein